ncbi:hypothetical protein FRB96_009208 [Tulasnella sp. 330]|nr:hypothetical protein FRB96_009208 [Tulasnella sp. 330]
MALQKEVLYAQAISWLLEATYEDVDLRSIAENIPTISHPREAIRILARSTYLPRLAIQYRNAMTTLQRTDNVNFRGRVDTKQETTTVLVLAGAVGHVLSSDPKWCYGVMRRIVNVIWPDASGEESEGRRELYLIHDALQGLCARFRIVNKSAELLVGYISGGLVADHDRGLRWARPESPALAHALVTLEIERHLTMNVSELRHLISALGVIPVNVPGILGVLTPQHLLVHPSVSPALVTALSLSDEGDAPLADETWELLNYVASTIHVGSTVPLVVIGAKLGWAIIRSFCRFSRHWLADSLRQDSTLAVGFKEAGAGSLFSYAVQAYTQSPVDGMTVVGRLMMPMDQ